MLSEGVGCQGGKLTTLCYLLIKINIIINTHKDRSRPVFDQSFDFPNCEGLKTGPQSRSFAVLGIAVLKRSGPVRSQFFLQSQDWTFEH